MISGGIVVGLAGLQLVVDGLTQGRVALPVVLAESMLPTGLGSLGTSPQLSHIVGVQRIVASLAVYLVVGGKHLVVIAQQPLGLSDGTAPVECLPEI